MPAGSCAAGLTTVRASGHDGPTAAYQHACERPARGQPIAVVWLFGLLFDRAYWPAQPRAY
eukprot:7916649-Pyramimonas_sp.AAC.1